MTDAHEQELLKKYNTALAAFKKLPRGDPRRRRYSDNLRATQRALKRYRNRRRN